MATSDPQSRRRFLSSTAGVTLGAVAAGSAAGSDVLTRMPLGPDAGRRILMPNEATLEAFRGQLNSRFRLATGSREIVELELIAARGLEDASAAAVDTARRVPFSLLFEGPARPSLDQGTYAIEHDVLGATAMFLVPVAPDHLEGRSRYEVIYT